ncbi:fibronectin type III domain-containing protein [Flavitalea sp.]|nr:LamG-like jellyroll fold domain-containing protein [Flavitalea sp.]
MKLFYLRLLGILCLCTSLNVISFAQAGVLNPNDPVVNYNSSAPPTLPAWGQMKKWVRTKRLSWNSDSYKAYQYKDIVFRIKFPKSYQHGVTDGKTYPVIIMLHGRGELGPIYDNEFQLYHGGRTLMDAVDNGTFDGFVLFPQNQYGYFGASQYDALREVLLNYMVPQVKLDPYKIFVNGLSAGGSGTWDFTLRHPSLFAGALPMSAVDASYKNTANLEKLKFINLWHFQGGLDKSPNPAASAEVGAAITAAGGNYKYTLYPNTGHDVWNLAWAEKQFFPFLLSTNKLNPVPLFKKFQFCQGEPVNVTLGISTGFDGYQWRKNGTVIANATNNVYNVTDFGTYDVRVRRGTTWSYWSPVPAVVKVRDTTITPNITLFGGTSRVIPSLASNKVTLAMPEGYASYTWEKVGSVGTIGTASHLDVTTPGDYRVKVTEQFGCVSTWSPNFTVVDADSTPKPDAPANLIASKISTTSIKLDWSDNPYPTNNETQFEIYQSRVSGGPYSLIGITGKDTTTFAVNNLITNVKYYYLVRAVGNSGASATTPEVSSTTVPDTEGPTAPKNLVFTSVANNTVVLKWNSSTDNVAMDKYEIYINDVKSYVTADTTFTCYNVTPDTSYIFIVKAIDKAGNLSAPSNYLSLNTGLKYKYYQGTWSVLPNFNNLTPVATGVYSEVSISPRLQNDNFGFLWEGYITIPVSGSYTFRTRSCDGSKLWIGSYNYSASPLVNNDGDHNAQDRDGTVTLTAGVYPISIAFFHNTGSESMSVSWRTPLNTNFTTIPGTAFSPTLNPSAPVAPSNLVATAASYNRINLTWEDNSDSETGFEIQRTPTPNVLTSFITVGTVGANSNSYSDSASLSGSTTYFYRIRSFNNSGASAYNSNWIESNWKFNNTYNDSLSTGRTITANGGPTFDNANKAEGTHSVYLNGTNNRYLTIPNTASFMQEAYVERTVAFWMKSANNTGNKVVLDLGGSDDGISVMISNNQLRVGLASNNVRVALQVPFTSLDWNHVAIVYNRNTLKFYLNGVLVVSNLDLPFVAMTTTSNGHRIGTTNGTNAFNVTSGTVLYNGWIDDLAVFSNALSGLAVNNVKAGTFAISAATTLALPLIPAAPINLTSSGVSTSANSISWTDLANNEAGYELYRSEDSKENYILIASLPANSNSFNDDGLFSNAIHYYKVRAVNDGGYSPYSNEDSAKTINVQPVVAPVSNQFLRFGTTLELNLNATVSSSEPITFSFTNLPAFATFTPGAINGTGILTFAPSDLQQGTYADIIVTATDSHGGAGTTAFQLVVNDNHAPVVAEIDPVNVDEKAIKQFTLTATDQNPTDVITWSFEGLPSFATTLVNGNSVEITLTPGYPDNGIYPVIAKADDGKNGVGTTSFNISVNDVTPASKKIYLNFTPTTVQFPVGAPWNSTNRLPNLNADFPNLSDDAGINTGIGFKILTPWQNQNNGTNTLGASTGNNSGIYPDNVLKTAYFTDANPQSMRFYKLDPGTKYSFTFFGSRGAVSDDRTSVYTINGSSVSLNAASNLSNTVTLFNMQPGSDSSLTVTLSKGASSAFGYLNAMVIETSADDGTAPAKPREVEVRLSGGKMDLTWVDAAYNESAYEVYRATSSAGPYILLTPGGNNANITQHLDSTISGNTLYYYYVKATNAAGSSPNSDTVSITSPNTSPVIGTIAGISLKTQATSTVNFTLTDDAGDIITLKTLGLPSFASVTNNGNGTGTINVTPGNNIGSFNVTLTANDDKGASSSRQFTISVTDKDITSTYVNFNTTIPVGYPWNSFNSLPYAGRVLTGLKADNDSITGVSITLVDGWESANDLGATTGDNTGIYPDNVMKTVFYESSTAVKRIRISGLNVPGRKYNLIFFASRLGGDNRTTNYTANGQTVSLNAANNVANTVQINGLEPDVNGVIEFTAQKATNSLFAYLGALVIQSYIDNGTPLAPTNLAVVPKSKTSIGLTWNDKSAGENGFEVYRSETYGGTYSLVSTTGPNATSFVDPTLQANKKYYYKVRAKLQSLFSEFSNIDGTATYSYSVFINFNRTDNAPLPWNNTARVPEQGYEFANLKSDQNTSTGINMVIAKNFSGDNPDGMNTRNNSGIYPDNVLRSSWWVDKGSTAELRIKNLNRAMRYSFVFLGSRNGTGDRTSVYTINGKSVSLNASLNTSQTVQLDYVEPDENGEVLLTISMTEWSMFAYLNSLVIHSYQVAPKTTSPNEETTTGLATKPVLNQLIVSEIVNNEKAEPLKISAVIPEVEIKGVKAYPNPFLDEVTIAADFTANMKNVTVQVSDLTGRVVFRQTYADVFGGRWNQRINLQGKATMPGVYIVQLLGPDNKRLGVIKLIKK